MFNKSNFKVFLLAFSTILVCSCNSLISDIQTVCPESIKVSIFDSLANKSVTGYNLYEVTTYPEGIVMKLQMVAEKYKYKDSLGVTCLPLLKEQSSETVRKFVLIKKGYVYTEYYLKNIASDTSLNAIRLKD